MSLVDPQFESNVISLLKGIYDNIGSKPYDTISGFFQIQSDGVNWSIQLSEVINETNLTIEAGAVTEGYVELVVVNAFDENTPYLTKQIQVINSDSMHPDNVISCQIINDDPDVILIYESLSGTNNFIPDPRGLGYGKDFYFSFEIRLYKA